MGKYTYTNFKSLVQDHLRDDDFTSNYTAEILRATNLALDDMNAGATKERMRTTIAFDFQKQITDISFVSGTTDYTIAIGGDIDIDPVIFKFPDDLRVDSDEDVYFSFVEPNYFFRRVGTLSSSEKMYALTYDGNTLTLKINHSATETLNLSWYSTYMIAVSGGATRASHIVNNADTFLFPDRYIGVLLNLTLNKLYGELKGFTDPEALWFLSEGRRGLSQIVASIGRQQRKPSMRIKIRGEWPGSLGRVSQA